VRACPGGALKFGEREELLREARSRIAAAPGKYINHVYGERELGGTTWLYLSDVSFHDLGFPFVSALAGSAVAAARWTPLAAGLWLANRCRDEAESLEPTASAGKGGE
jgi:formate dehydrogenase iron-sulfur subunit